MQSALTTLVLCILLTQVPSWAAITPATAPTTQGATFLRIDAVTNKKKQSVVFEWEHIPELAITRYHLIASHDKSLKPTVLDTTFAVPRSVPQRGFERGNFSIVVVRHPDNTATYICRFSVPYTDIPSPEKPVYWDVNGSTEDGNVVKSE